MQARGPLMVEHRLIERMIAIIQRELTASQQRGAIDPHFVDAAVDFIRTYADRTHHGKEEDILFRECARKELSADDQRVMQELLDEHVTGRQTTAALVAANERYRHGETAALADIVTQLSVLASFYPVHIAKEDKVFFPAMRAYFSDEEEQALLAEFWEFDRQMIHEKYKAVVAAWQSAS